MADRKKHISRGSLILQAILAPRRNTARFAKLFGRGSDVIARWSTGERVPVARDRARLEDIVGIPWRWWDEESLSDASDAEWLAGEEAREVISRPFPADDQAQAGAPDAA
jgi:hypothetical protein